MNEKKLKIARNKVDKIDKKIFDLIKKRTQIVKYMLTLKASKKQIVDTKRINEILNVLEIVSIKKELSVTPSDDCKTPRIIKTIKVIEILGTVVYVRYLICLKRSTLHTAAARFVVSLSGDNLSPK